eukprot:SAG11_NODE_18293_length_495_cov_0.777778_1_plen_53_part_10
MMQSPSWVPLQAQVLRLEEQLAAQRTSGAPLQTLVVLLRRSELVWTQGELAWI